MEPSEYIEKIGLILRNKSYPLKQRFRALFTLKNLGGEKAIDQIVHCFDDESALLKHELAYCLGQMKNTYAIPFLINLLENKSQEVVVRHEAAEALSAIGDSVSISILEKYRRDSLQELAETCELAVTRLKFLVDGGVEPKNIYGSTDPAPPSDESDINVLRTILLNEENSLYERYRAMFALRDVNTDESIKVLNESLKYGSVLFRHEIAFVLGQLQSPLSIAALVKVVENDKEHEIVRHESIEALGSIGTATCFEVIKRYLDDKDDLVRESCEVALDMCDYENSSEFQYANGLEIVSS